MPSNSVCNHSSDKQMGLPLRGRSILLSHEWLQTELDDTKSYYHYLFPHSNCRFSHDVIKIDTTKILILLRFNFMMYKSSLKLLITNSRTKWVLGFVLNYAWISKLLRDEAFTWQARAVMLVKIVTYYGDFCYLNSSCIRKNTNVF